MQQRQLRLGDILDDYCPRERRVTNHAIVAMVGNDVKQTRCTTCDTEHEFKHAKVPRQRRKGEAPAALYAQVAAGAPKRVVHETMSRNGDPQADELPTDSADQPADDQTPVIEVEKPVEIPSAIAARDAADGQVETDDQNEAERTDVEEMDEARVDEKDEGPIHRRLIRASLPRPEGQQPPARPIPEFTIRQPGGGRPGRFRPRHQRGGHGQQGPQFHGGNRSNGNMGGSMRGPRPAGGRPGMPKRHGGPHGRKRSK